MLIAAFKPGHDGSIAVVHDGRLIGLFESEKDSFPRYSPLTPATVFGLAEQLDCIPDVFALGGWQAGKRPIGAGYHGVADPVWHATRYFGKDVEVFSSSHVRSHIMMTLGMAPPLETPGMQAVLVWEGITGSFYLVDEDFRVVRSVPVLSEPGARYAFLFALADATFPDIGGVPNLSDSGKLMALAAYGDPKLIDGDVVRTVDHVLGVETIYPAPKNKFRDSPVYNSGVESEVAKNAAALLSERIFARFARMARKELPPGLPLRVSGGCGLNCDWNAKWLADGYFSSVFVPPCANDSGSGIGTAIDAWCSKKGSPHMSWCVYSGEEFRLDTCPDPAQWSATELHHGELAKVLADGSIVAWVQGRCEIGPRALGHRSLLAEPFKASTRDRLNAIKQRESYRPIAPCCRIEDAGELFDHDFADPYMLYFRRFRKGGLCAVTHVDGSARAQTVDHAENEKLHDLLSAFGDQSGIGVLCNTSLNFKGSGFINRTSDLIEFCDAQGVDHAVVGGTWYRRR